MHFAILSPDTVADTVEGSHISKPIACILDIEYALREGMKLYVSSNGVVLCESKVPRHLFDIVEVGRMRLRRGPQVPLSPPGSMPQRYDSLALAINRKLNRKVPAPCLPEEREETLLMHHRIPFEPEPEEPAWST